MSDISAVPQRSQTWRRFRIGLLFLLFAFLAVWKLLPPDVVRNPVVMGRGKDGKWYEQSQNAGKGFHFNAHVGVLKSQNNTTTASSDSHFNRAFLADRSLVIFNLSSHVLMERIGTELLQQLKADNHFDQLAYYPPGHVPETEAEAPDLWLSVNLESIEESGITGRELKATVTAALGSSFAASRHSVHDHLSPPIVTLNVNISVDHQSTLTGIESSSAEYSQQGKDIAKQLMTAVSDKLKTLREKHPPLPKLPSSLNPEFVAAPEFEFLKRLNATRQTSFHGFMFHNETFWQFTSTENAEPTLASIRDELSKSDWKVGDFEAADLQNAYLRAVKEDAILELFPTKRRIFSMPETKEPQGLVQYNVRYLHRISSDEMQAVVAELLVAPKPDVDELLVLRRFGSSEQQDQVMKLIEKHPPRSVEAWLMLAESYARDNNADACRAALVRATLLMLTVRDSADYDRRIKDIAAKQKIEASELKVVDQAVLTELGIAELVAGADPSTVEISANSAASFFVANDSEGSTVITARLQTDGRGQATTPTTVTFLQASEKSRSWSTQSAFDGVSNLQHQSSVGSRPISVSLEKLDSNSFQVTATLENGATVQRCDSRATGGILLPGWKPGPANVAISLRRDEPCTTQVVAPKPTATPTTVLMTLR